jgi:hypothetical protein
MSSLVSLLNLPSLPCYDGSALVQYYPVGYEGLQFVPGVKKQLQYSLRGIQEALFLNSVEVRDVQFSYFSTWPYPIWSEEGDIDTKGIFIG